MADAPDLNDPIILGANRRKTPPPDPSISGADLAGEDAPPVDVEDSRRDDPPERGATSGPRIKATIGQAKPMTKTHRTQLGAPLNSIWIGVGGATMAFDPFCGHVLIERGPEVTEALLDVAETNPKVRAALEQFATVSGWGAIFAAVTGVALPILAHHSDLIPDDLGRMLAPAGIDSKIIEAAFSDDETDSDARVA